jgi:hypothetical protein
MVKILPFQSNIQCGVMMGKRGYQSFQHVVENLAKTFAYDVEMTSIHPGYKFKYFQSYSELDAYFKTQFGENWRQEEWARFWMRDHNSFETREHSRKEIDNRGIASRSKKHGSRRYTTELQGPKQIGRRVAKPTLLGLIKLCVSEGVTNNRKIAKLLFQNENIEISHQTVWNLRKKYNI